MAFHSRADRDTHWKKGVLTKKADCLCCKEGLRVGDFVGYAGRAHEGRSYLCELCWDEYDRAGGRLMDMSRFRKE